MSDSLFKPLMLESKNSEKINTQNFKKILDEKYSIFKSLTTRLFEYLTKNKCKYGEQCFRKNEEHSSEYFHYREYEKLKNFQIESAFNFTKLIFDYLKHDYDRFSQSLILYFNDIKYDVKRNEFLKNVLKVESIEDLPDTPNFAILISIVLNTNYFLENYGNEILNKFIFLMEQEGITGIYEINIQNTLIKEKKLHNFETIYKNIYDLLKKSNVYNFSSEQNIRYNNISNTIILNYLENIENIENIEKQLKNRRRNSSKTRSRSRSRSRIRSSTSRKLNSNKIGGKKIIKVPQRYLPKYLSNKDKIKQKKMLNKSRKLYKKEIYFTRKKVKSFKSKKSDHVKNAEKLYNVNNLSIDNKLAKASGCSKEGLKQIVKKGEGAYYSSGSRPNQTPASWGYARLGSSITGSKAAIYDYKILEDHCKKNSKALKLAKKAFKKYRNSTVKKVKIN